MAAGYIDPLAAKAEESGGSPLTVVLEARDPEGEDRGETIAFEWSRGEMTPLSSPHRRGRGHLREFSHARTAPPLRSSMPGVAARPGNWHSVIGQSGGPQRPPAAGMRAAPGNPRAGRGRSG